MANNFVNRGEVLTLAAMGDREIGKPYREHGFNGVALIEAEPGEAYTFQIRGVFEFALADVKIGGLIYIDRENLLNAPGHTPIAACGHLYGLAVTPTDADGNFHCLIMQSE